MIRRWFLLVSIATACLGFGATSASALEFCVGATPGCSSMDASGLSAALTFANGSSGPDTVRIEPGTITLNEPFPVTVPVVTLPIASDTTLVGAGVGQTIFAYDGSMNVPVVIEIVPSGLGVGSASGFSVNLTGEAFPSNPGGAGVSVEGGTLNDFEIAKSVDNASGVSGLELTDGAIAHDGKITSTTAAFGGIRTPAGPATAHHIELAGSGLGNSSGVEVPPANAGSTLNFDHLKVSGFSAGVSIQNSNVNLEDSLIDLGTIGLSTGVGITASPAGADVDLDVDRVTVVGKGIDQVGFNFWSEGATTSSDATLNDYVFYNTGSNYYDTVCNGGTGALVTNQVSFGKHASEAFNDFSSNECQSDFDSNNRTAIAVSDFRDFANSDYRLRWDSALIDNGATGGALLTTATDLAGGKRVVDGDASGSAANDLGAYEYQRTAPSISVQASLAAAAPGQSVTYSVSGSDAEDETFSYAWAFDDGGSAGNVSSTTYSFSTPGIHAATVTATDEAGAFSTATAVVAVTTPTKPLATAKLTTRAKKAFVRSKSGFRKRTNPRATAFGITYKNAQVVRFDIQKVERGIKKGKTCRRGSTGGRRCTIYKAIPGIQRQDVFDGEIFYQFGGRIGGKKLRPGNYRVIITPFGEGAIEGSAIAVPFRLK